MPMEAAVGTANSILQELYAELQVMSVTSQSTAMARRPFAGLIFSFRMVIPVQTLQHTAMKVYVRPTTTNVRFSLALVHGVPQIHVLNLQTCKGTDLATVDSKNQDSKNVLKATLHVVKFNVLT